MKRSRLGPGKKSVERGSTFQRVRGNPRRRRASARFPGATGWTQRVFSLYGRRCLACGKKRAAQGHHVVPRQAIIGAIGLPAEARAQLAYDARNGMPVCQDCHAAHENASRRIPYACIPQGAIDWADEHGFVWYITKRAIYPRAA